MRLENRLVYCALVAPIVMVAGLGLLPRGAMAQTDDCDGWVALHDMLPRRYPVMVQTADGPLLFGGEISRFDNSPAFNAHAATCETWRFDGARWRFVTMDGPSPRLDASGAYDAARDRVVLFGGRTRGVNGAVVLSNETWEFADDVWIRRTTPNAPAATYHSAMVFDPSRERTYLYAGSQFWSYDGNDWTQVTTTGPNPGTQSVCVLVFDSRDNSIVLLPKSATAPTWVWNGTQWEQGAPTGVVLTTAAFDTALQTIVIASDVGNWYSFEGDGPAILASNITPPALGAKLYPTAVQLSDGRWLTVVAPVLTSALPYAPASYVVSFDEGWESTPSRALPDATMYMAFNYHPPQSEFVLVGGSVRHGSPTLGQTWLLRGETWRRSSATAPQLSSYAYSQFLPSAGESILLGKASTNGLLWSWDGANWNGRAAPEGLVGFFPDAIPPVVDPVEGVIVQPSGSSITTFDGTIRRENAQGLFASNGAAAFDPIRGGLVLAGGSDPRGTYQLLRTSDNALIWQQINATPQIGETAPRMAFDPERQGIIAFGGFNGPTDRFPRQTFFLASNATQWMQMPSTTNGPVGRNQAGMAYDPVARRIIMYGGLQMDATYPLRETWKLARGPAAVAFEPVDTYVVPGDTAEAFIIASGGGVIEYQWFKDGVALANSGRITGADSDTLQIQNFTSDDNGEYHVTVHNPCGDDQSITVQLRAIPACPGDFNDSGGVDATDLAEFFDAYQRGLMLADVDLSGGIDASDMALFIESFQAGGC